MPTTRKIPAQIARTKKETSRIAWAGVERGLKMLVTLVGTSAANAGLTRKVAARKRKEAAPSARRVLFFTLPSLLCSVEWRVSRNEGRGSGVGFLLSAC